MFGKQKKRLEPKVIEEPESAKAKQPSKPEKTPANAAPQSAPPHADLKAAENVFVGIIEYGSAVEIAEHIDTEIAHAKSALGGYLRMLDDVRTVAEKSKKLHDVVDKMSGRKQSTENPEQIDVNGLAIVLDATPLHELEALESVLRSHQERLLALQKAKDALAPLDQFGGTEGIRYLVLEREGVPEQILLKIS
jgi:hypothetical protein